MPCQKTLKEVQKRAGGADGRRLGEIAACLDIDKTIGMVLDKIEELGIADNTYVFYSADHGTPGRSSNAPLTLGKGSVWRVVCAFRYWCEGRVSKLIRLLMRGQWVLIYCQLLQNCLGAMDLCPRMLKAGALYLF